MAGVNNVARLFFQRRCFDCGVDKDLSYHVGTHLCEGCYEKHAKDLRDKYGRYKGKKIKVGGK